MLATLAQALPEARRFFLSERWGGYASRRPTSTPCRTRSSMPVLLVVWLRGRGGHGRGVGDAVGGAGQSRLCRYFFIHMRWKGVLRGMGAPGFMAYWLGLRRLPARIHQPLRAGPAQRLALLVLQVDLAFIMLSAGIYKFTAGYPRNHGMELGLCNPMWGYWWTLVRRASAWHPVFWTMNQLAWGTEVVAALLMLIPPTRVLGGDTAHPQFPLHRHADPARVPLRDGDRLRPALRSPGGAVDRWIAAIIAGVARRFERARRAES